jgi:hypothetical protein
MLFGDARGRRGAPRTKGDLSSATCCADGSGKLQNEAFQIEFQN